jgi:hypothetical protein
MSSPTSTVEPLNAVEDRYGGVRVDLVEEHMDCDVYVPRLKASISQWRQQVNQTEDLLKDSWLAIFGYVWAYYMLHQLCKSY